MTELRITLFSRMANGEVVPPKTKKTHNQIVYVKGRAVVLPSPEFTRWQKGCRRAAIYERDRPPIVCEVNCAALIYREARTGDAVGYYQAIADCLEELGVVSNDRLITQWDGTRLMKDPENPRVEITLTPIEGTQLDLLADVPVENSVGKSVDNAEKKKRTRNPGNALNRT